MSKIPTLQKDYIEISNLKTKLLKELGEEYEKLDKGEIPEELINTVTNSLELKKQTIYELVQMQNFYDGKVDQMADIMKEVDAFNKKQSGRDLFEELEGFHDKSNLQILSPKDIEKRNKIASSKTLRELVDNLNEMGDFTVTNWLTIKKDDLISAITKLHGSKDPNLQKLENVGGLRDKVKELLVRQELEEKQN